MAEKDARLSPAQRSAIRRIAARPPPEDAGGELNVVPFLDIIMNVLMFVLASLPVLFTATLTANAAPLNGPRVKEKPALHLTILLTTAGIDLKAAGGNVAPGCEQEGAGPTLPSTAGTYDWKALRQCVAHIKTLNESEADERDVLLLADPQIDYQDVIHAMDAVRETDAGDPLFDDVRFGVARLGIARRVVGNHSTLRERAPRRLCWLGRGRAALFRTIRRCLVGYPPDI